MRLAAPARVLASVLAVVALAPAEASAEDWSLESLVSRESMWSGFEIGTSVHHKESTDVMTSGKPEDTRRIRKESRLTLSAVAKDTFTVKAEKRRDGKWVASEQQWPKDATRAAKQPKAAEKQPGSVTVEGKTYACKSRRLDDVGKLLGDPMKRPAAGREATPEPGTVWVHQKLGVLKVEKREDSRHGESVTTMIATKLSVRYKVGDTELECREWTWTNSLLGGKTTRLESLSVPGRTVLTTGTVERGPLSMTHEKKLVNLTTKRKTPRSRK